MAAERASDLDTHPRSSSSLPSRTGPLLPPLPRPRLRTAAPHCFSRPGTTAGPPSSLPPLSFVVSGLTASHGNVGPAATADGGGAGGGGGESFFLRGLGDACGGLRGVVGGGCGGVCGGVCNGGGGGSLGGLGGGGGCGVSGDGGAGAGSAAIGGGFVVDSRRCLCCGLGGVDVRGSRGFTYDFLGGGFKGGVGGDGAFVMDGGVFVGGDGGMLGGGGGVVGDCGGGVGGDGAFVMDGGNFVGDEGGALGGGGCAVGGCGCLIEFSALL